MSCGFTTGSVSLQLAEKTENRKKTGKEEEKGTVKKTASTKEVKDRKNIYKKKIFLI